MHACANVDTGNNQLQVFSLTGEHLRSITGDWNSPQFICFERDRLYLVEKKGTTHNKVVHSFNQCKWNNDMGQCIFVLSLQGETLQVIPRADLDTFLEEEVPLSLQGGHGDYHIINLSSFNDKLLVTINAKFGPNSSEISYRKVHLMSLIGV